MSLLGLKFRVYVRITYSLAAFASTVILLSLNTAVSAEQPENAAVHDLSDRAKGQSPIELKAPIHVGSSSAAGDGGSIFLELVGAGNKRITILVTQDRWVGDAGEAPPNTLFIDAANPSIESDLRQGRLPTSEVEVSQVLRLLRDATKSNDSSSTSAVKEALKRLEHTENLPIRDEVKGIKPDWYAAFEESQRTRSESNNVLTNQKSHYVDYFPPNARDLLKPSNEEPYSDEEILRRASQIASSFETPERLCIAVCQALGVKNEQNWRLLDETDLIVYSALRLVGVEHFMESLTKIQASPEAMLGAARVIFGPGIDYGGRLDESEWRYWIPRLTKVVYSTDSPINKIIVVDTLRQTELPTSTKLLRQIAAGLLGGADEGTTLNENEVSARESAYLALAHRNDLSIRDDVLKELSLNRRVSDRAALEICLALFGEKGYLKQSHFNIRSRKLQLAALTAIEQYRGRHGIDILIYCALRRTSLVQNEAASVLQKLSGQRWLPDELVQRSKKYAEDASAWWRNNQQVFPQPYIGEQELSE